jgi:hypothetical protein
VAAAPLLLICSALAGDPGLHQTSMYLIDVVDLDVDLEAITG